MPEPTREFWDELTQALCGDEGIMVDRLESARTTLVNEEKKTRYQSFRLTDLKPDVAETALYNDYESFFELNKVQLCLKCAGSNSHVTLNYVLGLQESDTSPGQAPRARDPSGQHSGEEDYPQPIS